MLGKVPQPLLPETLKRRLRNQRPVEALDLVPESMTIRGTLIGLASQASAAALASAARRARRRS